MCPDYTLASGRDLGGMHDAAELLHTARRMASRSAPPHHHRHAPLPLIPNANALVGGEPHRGAGGAGGAPRRQPVCSDHSAEALREPALWSAVHGGGGGWDNAPATSGLGLGGWAAAPGVSDGVGGPSRSLIAAAGATDCLEVHLVLQYYFVRGYTPGVADGGADNGATTAATERQAELQQTLARNIANPLITAVHVLLEGGEDNSDEDDHPEGGEGGEEEQSGEGTGGAEQGRRWSRRSMDDEIERFRDFSRRQRGR